MWTVRFRQDNRVYVQTHAVEMHYEKYDIDVWSTTWQISICHKTRCGIDIPDFMVDNSIPYINVAYMEQEGITCDECIRRETQKAGLSSP